MKRPILWLALVVVSLASAVVAYRAFPEAFSIVSLDISMDRDQALAAARAIASRDHRGPDGYREAASFTLDDEVQTFVELEGGGKDVFTAMMRDGLYAAYTWRVRHFKEGEANEASISFSPDGKPNGFVEKIKEDATGPAIDATAARQIAEHDAASKWAIDFGVYRLVEQAQERRTNGRVDHTFTYERPKPVLNEGRYRLRLVVTGDRLTAVAPFVKVPEAFTRRYENMRSLNTAIGIGSVVSMLLLYGAGGIGIGLFVMLRVRWVLWTRAVWWGAVIAGLQTLASVNEWPLVWMGYDTAVPRTVFFGQQFAALLAGFFGFTAVYALSFMTAETLTRRAFGSHPQFWRVWSRGPGSSTAILGRTAGGYLLVSVFLAYDVLLYLFATHRLGWWSPSEALFQPDVLATYVPWFSAIANSAQAGFWEECLFRAVPLAGAALLGDRFGKRRLFLIVAFVIQAIVFGSGHAPYPNQPAYARPVELILPSIGFGLLYLYFGLLPGIILHFVFDTTWFALPIFVAHQPGIWIQRTMVVLAALVPLWIVLWRRWQSGAWTTLDVSDRNLAWMPEETAPAPAETAVEPSRTITVVARTGWYVAAGVSVAVCVIVVLLPRSGAVAGLHVSRAEAIAIAQQALDARHATLPPGTKFLAVAQDGSSSTQQLVSETAGEERRAALVGSYLPKPRWWVRAATFEGDVAQRAEEWQIFVTDSREPWPIEHDLPEDRAGASLDEAAARRVAVNAVTARWHFDVPRGDLREISATPTKQKARVDWLFKFVDETVPKLPKGEPRIAVRIAGDEVASIGRVVFEPEDWTRDHDAADARNSILQGISGLLPAAVLIGAAVSALMAWSRKRYTAALFVAGIVLLVPISVVSVANEWPALIANLSTAQPLQLQIGILLAVSAVALGARAVLVSLTMGALPGRLARRRDGLASRDAVRLGIAGGCVAAAAAAVAAWLRTPAWAAADVTPLDSWIPILAVVIENALAFLTRFTVLTTLLAVVDALSPRWNRGRVLEASILFVVGFTATGAPASTAIAPWLLASCVLGVVLAGLGIGLLTIDLTMVPIALGTTMVLALLMRLRSTAFPGQAIGALAAAAVVIALSWWWFGRLRRRREGASVASPEA